MYHRITSITPAYGGDVVCGTKDPHIYDAYLQYCADINKRIDELLTIRSEIQGTIEKVGDAKLRALLLGRYINFYTWESIAISLGNDWRYTMKLHAIALNEVENILKKT